MLKIALAQMEVRACCPDINLEKMLKFIEDAKKEEADIIIFPFYALSGDFTSSTYDRLAFFEDLQTYNNDILEASEGITILFSNHGDGRITFAASNKKFIEDEHHFDTFDLEIKGKKYHILCEPDAKRSREEHVFKKKFDFIVINAATEFITGQNKSRDETFRRCAKDNGCPMIYINCVGSQNTGKTIYTLDGHSSVYNANGDVIVRAKSFEEELVFFDFDEVNNMPPIEETEESDIAEIYQALYHGVKTFLGQIGIKKIVIGISGGIDSAVDAALYTKILGTDNVLLVNMPSVFNSATTKGLSEQLAKNLGCNYMIVPIQESVDYTVKQIESIPIRGARSKEQGASEIADNVLDPSPLTLAPIVRENIQARDRSSRVLAALAAAFGGGFTCNANKAETTIGYATMYGDCAGVVSALADLWKYQVYDLAKYFNEVVYGREVIPQGIIDIVPSAELSTAQNVDEGKGDPLKYPYHDYLFKAFVEAEVTPAEIIQWYTEGILEEKIGCEDGLVAKYFANAEEFINDLERWWNQFTGIAVAKRIQAPPIIAVTDHAFGSFFLREAQGCTYYSRAYKALKSKLLAK